MNKIYTIGFTGKSAEMFFNLLEKNSIKKLIDIRLNNISQLAGFTKQHDLKYFLKKILDCDYIHQPNFAPDENTLKKYKKKIIDWEMYTEQYIALLNSRTILSSIKEEDFINSVLLCSEHEPKYCHRRLLAEYLKKEWQDIEIIHLK
jgi:uncharacterized protein (DUF488 family)